MALCFSSSSASAHLLRLLRSCDHEVPVVPDNSRPCFLGQQPSAVLVPLGMAVSSTPPRV
eukprot:6495252-Heterocapsa_arctica.AAC.1